MNIQGTLFVFVPLAVIVIMIIGGAIVGGPWGHGFLAGGIIGIVLWAIFAVWLGIQMNTDI